MPDSKLREPYHLFDHKPRRAFGGELRTEMGMFDDVRCEHPLPANDCDGLEFQTKDLDCDLDQLVIRADGTLWRTATPHSGNPLGHLSDYFGEVHFYTSVGSTHNTPGAWLEFRARFVDGKLYGPIVLIEDSRPAGLDGGA